MSTPGVYPNQVPTRSVNHSSEPKVDSEVKIQSCVWRVQDVSTVFLSTPGVGRSYWGHAQGSERAGTRQSEIAQGWLQG